jgi:hypothetical protein
MDTTEQWDASINFEDKAEEVQRLSVRALDA